MYVSGVTCLGYIRWTIFRVPDHTGGSGLVQHDRLTAAGR
jgi:hypothetical protein